MELVLVYFNKYLQSILVNYPLPTNLHNSGGLLEKIMFIQGVEADYHNRALCKVNELLSNTKSGIDQKDLKSRLLETVDLTFNKFKAGTL